MSAGSLYSSDGRARTALAMKHHLGWPHLSALL